jgi:hypothetical protein
MAEGVEAARDLRDREETDEHSKEEQVRAHREKESEATDDQTLTRAVMTRVSVSVTTASAGMFQVVAVGRTTPVSSVVLFGAAGVTIKLGGRNGRRHLVASQRDG